MTAISVGLRWLVRVVPVLCMSVEAGCASTEVHGYCNSSVGVMVTAHPPDRVLRIVGHGPACEGQTFDCGPGSSDCNPKDGNAHATFQSSATGDCRIDVELIGGCILSGRVEPRGARRPEGVQQLDDICDPYRGSSKFT